MKYFLSTLLLFAAFVSNAQEPVHAYPEGGTYEGYVILKDGTQKNGFIRYSNPYGIQNTVVFFADKDDKDTKEKFDTDELKEYRVGEKTYHVIYWSGGLTGKALKGNLLIEDGCISTYRFYGRPEAVMPVTRNPGESDDSFLTRKYSPQTVYKNKNDDKCYQTSYFGLKFSKKMSEFISDNEELSEKVANKEKGYKMLNMDKVITEYNEACTED
ncbi:MAG: hypothetical protein ACFHU9_01205 [Fluviicola sp.]